MPIKRLNNERRNSCSAENGDTEGSMIWCHPSLTQSVAGLSLQRYDNVRLLLVTRLCSAHAHSKISFPPERDWNACADFCGNARLGLHLVTVCHNVLFLNPFKAFVCTEVWKRKHNSMLTIRDLWNMSPNWMRRLPALRMNVRMNITQRNLYSLWMIILLNKMPQAGAAMPSHDTELCTISCSQWAGTARTTPYRRSWVFFLVSCLLVCARTGFWMHKWNTTVKLIQQWSPELRPILSRLCKKIPKQWPNIHGWNFCICWPSFDVMTHRVARCQSNVLDTGDTEGSSFRYLGSDDLHPLKTSCWPFLQRYESVRLLWIHRLCLASKCALQALDSILKDGVHSWILGAMISSSCLIML